MQPMCRGPSAPCPRSRSSDFDGKSRSKSVPAASSGVTCSAQPWPSPGGRPRAPTGEGEHGPPSVHELPHRSDAGSVLPDAGKPFDAGEPPDAGAPFDAGSAPRDAGAAVDAGPPTLLLDEPRQVIDGFGGANAWAGLPADAAAKQKVMDLLFSTSKGAGLSIIRNRIPFRERTDLDDKFLTKDASGNYVSSTNPDGSKTFSLDWNNWDLAGTRALYRALESCGADCQVSTFFSTPWTPPNNRLSNWKSGVPDPVNAPEIGGHLDPAHYRDYADVLADYALGFSSAMGNSLTAVSIQNEPNWSPQYESCSWTAAQFAAFVPILRQEFAAKGVPASVLVMAPEDMNFKDAEHGRDTANALPSRNRAQALSAGARPRGSAGQRLQARRDVPCRTSRRPKQRAEPLMGRPTRRCSRSRCSSPTGRGTRRGSSRTRRRRRRSRSSWSPCRRGRRRRRRCTGRARRPSRSP
jgi:hypothetical protein